MAEPLTSEDPRKVELQHHISSKGGRVHFVKGRHLFINGVENILTREKMRLNESGKKMLETLKNMRPHSFKYIQQEFQVSRLQHVTDKSSMNGIYDEEGFKITQSAFRSEFKDFSFWSAVVAPEDIMKARKEQCQKARWLREGMSVQKIRAQFANSPAFERSSSRYGNFKFSFQLSHLLSLYCGGEEPQLRILGTDMYKQEITHYILVHSPGNSHQFRDLPMVPTITDTSKLPCVYLRDKTMHWRPESTSIFLKEKISKCSPGPKTCHPPCEYYKKNGFCGDIKKKRYKVLSVWNHLVFAFHLPDRVLKIQKEQLLKSLTACKKSDSPLLEEDKWLEEKEAKEIIRKMKSDFSGQKRKRSSQVLKGEDAKGRWLKCLREEALGNCLHSVEEACQRKNEGDDAKGRLLKCLREEALGDCLHSVEEACQTKNEDVAEREADG